MACGVHLGILLVCLVQAEHVCCSWASQAQGDAYVGVSQQDSGLKKPGGSSPQNGIRQASVSTGSAQNSDRRTAVISGHSQLVASRLESKPAKRKTNWLRVHLEKGFEKQSFNLYNPIASGSSISNFNKNQNSQTNERKPTLSTEYLPSNSPFGGSHSFTSPSQSAAQGPAYYGQRGSSSSLFSTGAASRQQNSARLQASACGLGRRVPFHHPSGVSEPSHVLRPLSESTRNHHGHAPYRPHTHSGLGRGSSKPSCPSVQQVPSSVSSSQASWNNRSLTQGAHDLPVSGSSREGASAQRFAPSRTYSVPQSFGGYAIRRPKTPADQKEDGALKPQQPAAYKPQFYRVPQRTKWIRIKPGSQTQQVQQNESDLK